MFKKITICFFFMLSCYIAAHYICSSIDQADKVQGTGNVLFADFKPYDMTLEAWKERKRKH